MLQTIIFILRSMLRDRHVHSDRRDLQAILHNRDDHIVEVRVQVLKVILRECHAILANLGALRDAVSHHIDELQIVPYVQSIVTLEVVTAHAVYISVICDRLAMLGDCHVHRDWVDLQAILHDRDVNRFEVRVQVLKIILRERHAVLANLGAFRNAVGYQAGELQVIPYVQPIVAHEVVAAHTVFDSVICDRLTMLRDFHVHRDWFDDQAIITVDNERHVIEVSVDVLEECLIEAHAIATRIGTLSRTVSLRSVEPHVVLEVQWVAAIEVVTRHNMFFSIINNGVGVFRNRHDNILARSDQQHSISNIECHVTEVRVHILELILIQIHRISTNGCSANRRITGKFEVGYRIQCCIGAPNIT